MAKPTSQEVVDEFYKELQDTKRTVVNGSVKRKGKISWMEDEKGTQFQKYPLGSAGFLFIGKWEDKIECVVRKYLKSNKDKKDVQRELAALRSRGNIHPNFIRYFGEEEDVDFCYYAVELCRFSIAALFKGRNAAKNLKQVLNAGQSYNGREWNTLEMMRQTAEGLQFLHDCGFIHRNISPRNVLIAEMEDSSISIKPPEGRKKYMVKLCDFRYSKQMAVLTDNSVEKNETFWSAPEMKPGATLTSAVDLFLLGCFFYYILSNGKKIVMKTTLSNEIEQLNCDKRLINLIQRMVKKEPEQRPDLRQVLEYFQTFDYFPIYDQINEENRPGLCVIINQQHFINPFVHSCIIFLSDTDKSLCTKWHLNGGNEESKKLFKITEEVTEDAINTRVEQLLKEKQLNQDQHRDACIRFFTDINYSNFETESKSTAELLAEIKSVSNCQFKSKHFNKIDERKGSDVDVKILSERFLDFGYDLRFYANLTAGELCKTIINLAEEKNCVKKDESIFNRYKSLVVCLLSHGGLGTVFGIDGKEVKVLDLQDAFNSQACPGLKGKPKVFIIQACQGEIGQRMIPNKEEGLPKSLQDPVEEAANTIAAIASHEIHSYHLQKYIEPKHSNKDKHEPYIPYATVRDNQTHETLNDKTAKEVSAQFRDVVTLWSTIEGYVSVRYTDTGSEFIQKLDEQLKNFGGKPFRDLYEAHLAATQDMAIKRGAIEIGFTLDGGRKKLYWINQTPLYKSSTTHKIGFKRITDDEREKINRNIVDIFVASDNKTFETLVKNLEPLKVLYKLTIKHEV